MSAISIDSVHKHYGAVSVLQGIDLHIEQGSVLALLGPSGCGKTTLLRLIAGFDPVDQGQIAFGEVVMASQRQFVPPERRRIGYVPQEGALFPHLTVAGNLRYGLPRRRDAARRVAEVLELIGLEGYGERYPHELSGGQQQRVALGRALAPEPMLVLLDEPFNALTWTCAAACAKTSSPYCARPAPPPSWSPTIRARPLPSRTSWRSCSTGASCSAPRRRRCTGSPPPRPWPASPAMPSCCPPPPPARAPTACSAACPCTRSWNWPLARA